MIELFIAFSAGLISFLSPCVLPLIPGYISFISGASLNELLAKKKIDLLPLILFSLGFSFVFIIFGAAASYLGQILLQNSQTLRIVAGLIIIIFSLQLLGILKISFLNFEKKIYTKKNNNIYFSFVVGMAFGFGWTPCIGPILGSILALASTEETMFKAVILLSFYSLGFGHSVCFIRLFNAKIFNVFQKFQKEYQFSLKNRWIYIVHNWNFNFNQSVTDTWLLYFKYLSIFTKFRIIINTYENLSN